MGRNRHIEQLFMNVRILPSADRGQGERIFAAFSACVMDLGGGDLEVSGQKDLGVTAKSRRMA